MLVPLSRLSKRFEILIDMFRQAQHDIVLLIILCSFICHAELVEVPFNALLFLINQVH